MRFLSSLKLEDCAHFYESREYLQRYLADGRLVWTIGA